MQKQKVPAAAAAAHSRWQNKLSALHSSQKFLLLYREKKRKAPFFIIYNWNNWLGRYQCKFAINMVATLHPEGRRKRGGSEKEIHTAKKSGKQRKK